MKYFYIFLIFIFGVALGRWSAPDSSGQNKKFENIAVLAAPNAQLIPKLSPAEPNLNPQITKDKSTSHQSPMTSQQNAVNPSGKPMRELFDQLMEANQKDDLVQQARLLAEMESLDPRNEKVFQAKAMILQDDDNWDGAHKVLEECITAIPSSIFCLRRLANIRSSTTEDKLRYGSECLRFSKNDPLCLVDVALALNSKGEFAKAKVYFELALSLPQGSEGYHRDYILYSYAFALEGLNMLQKANEALTEACKLRNKSACEKLKTS